MVITGAGDGIMGAAQEGAGGEQSFGLNIRLPFEQEANPWIASDPKLVTFKYFFTRKLFLVKEASALALFPGGFGTMDEAFEVLTLMQTGKATIIPMVMVEDGDSALLVALGGMGAWDPRCPRASSIRARRRLLPDRRLGRGGGRGGDALLPRVPLGAHRRREPRLPPAAPARPRRRLEQVQQRFADILRGPVEEVVGPVRRERAEFPELPRLVLPFNRGVVRAAARADRLRELAM